MGEQALRGAYDGQTAPQDFIRRFYRTDSASLEGHPLTPEELFDVRTLSEPQFVAALEAANGDRQLELEDQEAGRWDTEDSRGDDGAKEFKDHVQGLGEYFTLKHQATSGITLTNTPGKTTTILGRFGSDTGDIILELGIPKGTDFSGNPGGFNLLNTPDDLYIKLGADGFWNEYNKPFLDAAIDRGDEILMATPINASTLYTVSGDLTGYGREYYYLLSKGYELVDGRMIMKGVY